MPQAVRRSRVRSSAERPAPVRSRRREPGTAASTRDQTARTSSETLAGLFKQPKVTWPDCRAGGSGLTSGAGPGA